MCLPSNRAFNIAEDCTPQTGPTQEIDHSTPTQTRQRGWKKALPQDALQPNALRHHRFRMKRFAQKTTVRAHSKPNRTQSNTKSKRHQPNAHNSLRHSQHRHLSADNSGLTQVIRLRSTQLHSTGCVTTPQTFSDAHKTLAPEQDHHSSTPSPQHMLVFLKERHFQPGYERCQPRILTMRSPTFL